jgi:sec-independent protein translocase protein TatB
MADTLILMVLALVVFGPRRLPQIGRQIGKLLYEFRKASNDFKFQMEEELRLSEEADRRQKEEEERQRLAAIAAPILPPAEPPAQTIEAQADIGAVEGPVEPATATPAAGESDLVEGFSAEVAERVTEPAIPTIQPPQTGEQVAAFRPGSAEERAGLETDGGASPAAASLDTASPATSGPAAKNGANPEPREPNVSEPDGAASVAASVPAVEAPIPPKEPVSQHG